MYKAADIPPHLTLLKPVQTRMTLMRPSDRWVLWCFLFMIISDVDQRIACVEIGRLGNRRSERFDGKMKRNDHAVLLSFT